MDDLISRQAAIKDYQRVCAIVTCGDCPFHIVDGAFTDCRLERWLKALPSAQPEQQWIPCSERPPELGKYVMVTTSWMFVTKAMYCGEHWEIDGIDYKKSSVTAWMPLPEPWKGE